MNLKQVRFKQYSSEPQTLRISKHGQGPILASDIFVNDHIEVLNPDLHIATLGSDGKFEAEVIVSLEEDLLKPKHIEMGFLLAT